MKIKKVDVAIIGAGTAGLSAYREVIAQNKKAVLIEGGKYGTTCARVGCMPSKLMIAAADAVHHIQKAPTFGIHPTGTLEIHGTEVMDRIRSERDRFVSFVLDSVNEIPKKDKLRGYAHFLDSNTLQIDQHTQVQTNTIVIATGSTPAIPPILQNLGDRLLLNEDLFEWKDLPSSVAVFGPGIIGLELGQSLHRLGVRVVILGRGGFVGPLTDPVIRNYSAKTFSEELYLDPDANVSEVKNIGDSVAITYKDIHGDIKQENFEYVLAATGRIPNLQHLKLEHANIQLNERGIPVFDRYTLQCSKSNIFIAGDVNNDVPLLHEAADEGKIAGKNAALFPEIRAGHRRAPISVMFSDPQIAMVGRTFQSLPTGCFTMGEVSFENQGRSRVMLKNKGLLHVYAEHGTGLFLGAEMIGPAAEHIAHLLSWSYQQRLTVSQMLEMPFYHPVIEEGVRTALRDVNSKLRLGPSVQQNCLDCGPGV